MHDRRQIPAETSGGKKGGSGRLGLRETGMDGG